MSNIAVIYASKTGFTARYAHWLQKALHADLYRYKSVDSALLASYDIIIYGAGFYSGRLLGAGWFSRLAEELSRQRLLVFACGSMPVVQPQDLAREWDMSFSRELQSRLKLFYLPGGINYARLGLMDHLLMRLFRWYMLHSRKTDPDTLRLIKRLAYSVDYTEPEALLPLLQAVK